MPGPWAGSSRTGRSAAGDRHSRSRPIRSGPRRRQAQAGTMRCGGGLASATSPAPIRCAGDPCSPSSPSRSWWAARGAGGQNKWGQINRLSKFADNLSLRHPPCDRAAARRRWPPACPRERAARRYVEVGGFGSARLAGTPTRRRRGPTGRRAGRQRRGPPPGTYRDGLACGRTRQTDRRPTFGRAHPSGAADRQGRGERHRRARRRGRAHADPDRARAAPGPAGLRDRQCVRPGAVGDLRRGVGAQRVERGVQPGGGTSSRRMPPRTPACRAARWSTRKAA